MNCVWKECNVHKNGIWMCDNDIGMECLNQHGIWKVVLCMPILEYIVLMFIRTFWMNMLAVKFPCVNPFTCMFDRLAILSALYIDASNCRNHPLDAELV